MLGEGFILIVVSGLVFGGDALHIRANVRTKVDTHILCESGLTGHTLLLVGSEKFCNFVLLGRVDGAVWSACDV